MDGETIIRIIVGCFVPYIVIGTAQVLNKMDRGETTLFDRVVDWVGNKIDIYYDDKL